MCSSRLVALAVGTVLLVGGTAAHGQIPQARPGLAGQTAAYAVSYIEVRVHSEATAIAALRKYREASRTEDGCIRVEIFEQVSRPGHFVTVETWTNERALAAHDTAISATRLSEDLDPIRSSDYDRRVYKALAVASSSASARAKSVVVVSHVDTLPSPQSDAPGLLGRFAATSRGDVGNTRFDVMRHTTRPNHFTIIETWQNPNALQAHADAEHTRQYRESLKTMSGSPLDERLYQALP
jgi:quinol monooxygenase YgiN